MDGSVVVIDNGAGDLKAGIAGVSSTFKRFPNCTVKPKSERKLVGDEVSLAKDFSALFYRRPFERGYVVNWELEMEIWNRAFSKHVLGIRPADHHLLLTEAPFAPEQISRMTNEVVFENYGFRSLCKTSSSFLAQHNALHDPTSTTPYPSSPSILPPFSPCTLVVDSGYSFTHVIPFFDELPINFGIKRINIGGKALTNYLKEIISYRQWNMMDDTFLVNLVKEKLCYVSRDFYGDLQLAKLPVGKNPIRKEYVLPNYTTKLGYIKGEEPSVPLSSSENSTTATQSEQEEDQLLAMNNERITVPEALFHPSDIGVNQAGIAETILQSINATCADMRPALSSNILLVGGNAAFPGFKERLETELRMIAPWNTEVTIYTPEELSTSSSSSSSSSSLSSSLHSLKPPSVQFLTLFEEVHGLLFTPTIPNMLSRRVSTKNRVVSSAKEDLC